MAVVPLMQREMRRHFVMNCCLVAATVVGGIAITNERGVFSPLGFNPFSAYAEALGAAANPIGPLRALNAVPAAYPVAGFGRPGVVPGLRNALAGLPGALPPGAPGFVAPPPFAPAGIAPLPLAGFGNPAGGGFGGAPGGVPFGFPPAGGNSQPGQTVASDTPPVIPVPEPATWALMITGFGLIGGMLRAIAGQRRQREIELI